MSYVIWILAAILAILNVTGVAAVSWWIIFGLFLLPFFILIAITLGALGLFAWMERR